MSLGRLPRRPAPELINQINVTPLVDVMLVLLVIFILTAPFLGSAIKLDLPRAAAGAPAAPAAQTLLLELDRQGQTLLNGQPVSTEQLARGLAEVAASRPGVELQLRADQAVPYGQVVQMLALAQQAGIARIGFVTDPPAAPRRP
jgi:biopolymer transport protein TolR